MMKKSNFSLSLTTDNNSPYDNKFPIDVFPEKIQNLIKDAELEGISKNFLATSILSAASTAIGNSYNVSEIKTVPSMIFAALVGSSSSGKSPAMNLAFDPITNFEDKNIAKYYELKQKYEEDLFFYKALPIKERKQQKPPVLPKLPLTKIDKITAPSLRQSLKANPRSLTFYKGELMGIIKALHSSMEEDLITVWDGDTLKDITMKRGVEVVPSPFLNVLGGIQPDIISALNQGSRKYNGFIYRFLFSLHEGNHLISSKKTDSNLILEYEKIINKLLNLKLNFGADRSIKPKILSFDDQSKSLYKNWREDFVKNYSDSIEESIVSKLQNYSLRFTLILQLLSWAASEDSRDKISLNAINGSIKITEYFKQTAIQVQNMCKDTLGVKNEHPKKQRIIQMINEGYTQTQIIDRLNISSKTISKYAPQKNA